MLITEKILKDPCRALGQVSTKNMNDNPQSFFEESQVTKSTIKRGEHGIDALIASIFAGIALLSTQFAAKQMSAFLSERTELKCRRGRA